jgi:hypothetical protein
MEQLAIAFTGVIAIWLSQDCCAKRRRYACLFGLAGQPFWFYSAWQAEQWGIFCLCLFYTWAWLKGVRTHWLRRDDCLEQGSETETARA